MNRKHSHAFNELKYVKTTSTCRKCVAPFLSVGWQFFKNSEVLQTHLGRYTTISNVLLCFLFCQEVLAWLYIYLHMYISMYIYTYTYAHPSHILIN